MIEFKNVSVAFQQGEEHVDAVRKAARWVHISAAK